MEYSIWEGNLCYATDYPTIKEACTEAERFIRGIQFGELEDVTIREGRDGKIVRTFHPEIEWR